MNKHKVYKSVNSFEPEALLPTKEIEDFEPVYDFKTTQLFSSYNPDQIEQLILKHLVDHDVQYKCSENKYKIKFEIEKTTKQGQNNSVGFCIRILKVNDQKYAIEFTKT